jgi:5-methyltetrahydropteroyltriglutamate--homocysteine methyltransferase
LVFVACCSSTTMRAQEISGRSPTCRTTGGVVRGLVSTKRARLEAVDDLVRRIEEASRYVPFERLAVSPQCGFATSVVGNALRIEDQRAKLGRVAEVARRLWG